MAEEKQFARPLLGNVRELRNILFIATTHSGSGLIDADTVVKVMQMHAQSHGQVSSPRTVEVAAIPAMPAADTAASLHDVEARHISQLLQQHNNNRRQVAEALGVSERTLYRTLKKFELTQTSCLPADEHAGWQGVQLSPDYGVTVLGNHAVVTA